jgi:hypothetical protein
MTKIQRLLKMPTVLLGTALLATSCAGTVGSAGSAGAQGPAGPQGPQGLTGAIGSTGPQGPVGPAGPQGLAGAQGPRGFSGSDGSQGSNGLSAYQIYTAEYPGYLTLAGASQANWINDFASNKLFNAIQFNYTSQTDFAADFVEPTHAAVFKGQTTAQKSLASLFGSLVNEAGRTTTIAAYNLEFFSDSSRTVAVNPTTYVYGTHTIIYVKATLIGITSIVLKNETTGLDIVATGNSATGFALTVPKETVGFENEFTHYLATTNANVKTDGIVYADNSGEPGTEFLQGGLTFFSFRDGAVTVGTNSTDDLLDDEDPARSSFGIWQRSGAPANGKYLSFQTAITSGLVVWFKIIYSDDTVRNIKLTITVPNAPTAAAANVDVASSTGSALSGPVDLTLTLTGETFKAISAGANLASWITNLPTGLTAVAKDAVVAGGSSVTIEINGTPTVARSAAMTIVIPFAALTIARQNLTVTTNANAKFTIS